MYEPTCSFYEILILYIVKLKVKLVIFLLWCLTKYTWLVALSRIDPLSEYFGRRLRSKITEIFYM